MKISIVMSIYNRRHLILHTLKSISQTAYKDIEVIIVDDASDPEHQLDDIVNDYWFPIKLIKIKEDQRWWKMDCCVCMNIGVEAASGSIIVLQQHECCHIGDVLLDVSKNVKKNNCTSYSCYSLNEQDTVLFLNDGSIVYNDIPETPDTSKIESSWINHPYIIPSTYSYCMSMTRNNWQLLGVADMDFSNGFGYADMDLRDKIWRRGIQMVIPDPRTVPFVVHLYHPASNNPEKKKFFEISGVVFSKKSFERERYYNLLRSLNVGPTPKPGIVRD